jgi:hypothetical protein
VEVGFNIELTEDVTLKTTAVPKSLTPSPALNRITREHNITRVARPMKRRFGAFGIRPSGVYCGRDRIDHTWNETSDNASVFRPIWMP